jgi:hypothetical protein
MCKESAKSNKTKHRLSLHCDAAFDPAEFQLWDLSHISEGNLTSPSSDSFV